MKKLLFMFAVMTAICFTSCGNSTQTTVSNDTLDTVAIDTVDTLTVDTTVCPD